MTESTESSCPKCGVPIPEHAPQGLCPKCALSGADIETESIPASRACPPPTVDEVAAEFPEFEILECIGAGGMGAVYKARQPKLERFVALKILSLDLAEDPAFAERFNREARVLARLNHPNIVTVFDFGIKGSFVFLLMEYIDGVNLRQAMEAGGFTPADSLALVQDVYALQFAHEEGILHRDIKPENILLDARGRVKIADFGIAKLIGEDEADDLTLTAQGSVLGSLRYMAPEQIESPGEVDQRADIYSLGVVFYELLTGEVPMGKFEPPSKNTPMDSRIDEIVMRTLARERKLRYQTVGEVKTSVAAITKSHADGEGRPGAVPVGVDAAGALTAKRAVGFATASTAVTGASLFMLFLLVPAMLFGPVIPRFEGHRDMSVVGIARESWPLLVGLLIIVGVPALLGFIFGTVALGKIREADGSNRGLGRALFGTLTWPLLFIISLISIGTVMGLSAMFGPGLLWYLCAALITVAAGVFVILSVWRWAQRIPRGVRSHEMSRPMGPVFAVATIMVLLPSLAILVPWAMFALNSGEAQQDERNSPRDDIDWRLGRPEIELAITVAPMHVATFALVRTDASGKEESLNLEGYAIAPDSAPFECSVQIGSSRKLLDQNGKPRWTFYIKGSGGTISSGGEITGAFGGPRGSTRGDNPGDWVYDTPEVPNTLNLTTPGRHSLIVASPARDFQGKPVSTDTLTLQVITQHRSGPGVPEVAHPFPSVGGGSTDWIKPFQRK